MCFTDTIDVALIMAALQAAATTRVGSVECAAFSAFDTQQWWHAATVERCWQAITQP